MTTAAASTPLTLTAAARSDVGQVRATNQDFAYAGPLAGRGRWHLLAVADGVGGNAGGEWASQTAVETLMRDLVIPDGGTPAEALAGAVQDANRAVYSAAAQRPQYSGASTTLVAAAVLDHRMWWANVGDSRLYLVRSGVAEQLTADHSWVAEQVRAGRITADEAAQSDQRNVITRSVGFEPRVTVDTGGPVDLLEGDVVLLCSDGLHGLVGDEEIATTASAVPPSQAAERLIALANGRGGTDNITVVIGRLDVSRPLVDTTRRVPQRRPGGRRRILVAVIVTVVALACGVAAWFAVPGVPF